MESTKTLTSSSLEIHLLGRFRLFVDGEELRENEIKGRKARLLLKLLAHRRNFQMAREQATDLLWQDLGQDAANAQLYKAIHHLRNAMEKYHDEAGEWIEIRDQFIHLDPPGGVATDARLFEEAAGRGLRDHGVSDLEYAVSLYYGEFLPMDRYAGWAAPPREHYRQLYLDVLMGLAEEYEKRGELSEAAEMLRRALELESALESAHRGLMRVFARKGQATRAFHQYEICREMLSHELGLDPSPQTVSLLDDIREGALKKDRGVRERSASLPGSPAPIIGRGEACKAMELCLDELSGGQGGGLVVSGEAGIGKTRLLQDLIRRARRRELPFFLGRSGQASGNITYGPFVELLDDILYRFSELEEELPLEIGRLVPSFEGKGDPVPHADKRAAKGHLFARVHDFFSSLAEKGPCVVILEDLHEADRISRELFSYLVRHLKGLPVLFAGTLRKEEGETGPDFLDELRAYPVEMIELAPLTYEEHAALLQQHAGDAIIGGETARRMYRLAEGNPFYALELLRHYRNKSANGLNREQDLSAKLPGAPALDNIPSSLRELVEEKLEDLSPPAHHLLHIAAIIGRRIPYDLMVYIWSGDKKQEAGDELFRALEEVVEARLLEERGLDYRFRHALVREAIYSSISRPRRTVLHRQVADRLIEPADGEEAPVELIAGHYLGARDLLEGVRYLVRAGIRAEDACAHEDALQRYREACDILGEVEGREGRELKRNILERTGDVYRACGKLEMSDEAYEEAISLAEEMDTARRDKVELYRKMSVVAIFRTDIERSGECLEKASGLMGDDARMKARVFITKALHLWHLNQLEAAYDIAEEALREAERVEARVEASQAHEILAMACLPLGRWEEGLRHEMERQYRGWSPEIVVATDAHLCLWEYHLSGDQPLRRARSFMEQIARQASEMGDMRCVAVCHYALGTMYLWRGERQRAVEELSESLDLHQEVGSPAGMAYSLARKSVLHTLAGAGELGLQAVEDGLAYAEQAAVRDHCLQRLYGVGIWNRIEAGDVEKAGHMVNRSEELLEDTGACGACALELYPWMAYYYLDAGRMDRARACGEAVLGLVEQTDNPIGKAIASMIESSLCVTEKKRDRAEDCARKAFKILEENVPETEYSPVSHYLERMVEQQRQLA